MLKAGAMGKDGKPTVLLGITPQDLERVSGDGAVVLDLQPWGINGRLLLVTGASEEDIADDLAKWGLVNQRTSVTRTDAFGVSHPVRNEGLR